MTKNRKIKIAIFSFLLSVVLYYVVIVRLRIIKEPELTLLFGFVSYFFLSYFLIKKYAGHKSLVIISIHLAYLPILLGLFVFFYERVLLVSIVPNLFFIISSFVALWVLRIEKKRQILSVSFFVLSSVCFSFVLYPFYVDFVSNYINRLTFTGAANEPIERNYVVLNEDLKTVQLFSNSDNLLALDMWTKYCKACFEKFPDFEELSKDYAAENMVFKSFGIPLREDTVEDLKEIQDKYGLSFEKVYGQNDNAFKDFKFQFVPTILLLKDGQVIYKGTSYFWLKRAIKAHS